MNLVIPISTADVHLAEQFFKILKQLGPYEAKLILVCSPSTKSAAEKYLSQVKTEFFGSFIWEVSAPDVGNAWPSSPNLWFNEVALRMCKEKDLSGPWYWCELDSVPLGGGWLNVISVAYHKSGKKILGGERLLAIGNTKEPYLVGCMVYPHDVWVHTSIKYAAATQTAWDVYCRYEFKLHGVASQLIHHNWRTINYRRENGKIVWDEIDPASQSQMWGPETVLVHGCKDGSLGRLLYFPEEVAVTIPPAKETPTSLPPAEAETSQPEPPKVKRRRITRKASFLVDSDKPAA